MKNKPSRRQFVTSAALAAAAPLTLSGLPGSACQAQPAQPVQPAKDPRAAAAQALTEVVRARFGKHLTEAQLKNVLQAIAQGQAGAEAMKRVPLENGDEPAFVFFADI